MESSAHIDNLYSPLNESTSEIRLLKILPSKDVVRCSLSKATLSEKFIAISYCWGDASDTENIEVNGVVFPATRNLVAFFHQFLRGGEPPGVDKWGKLLSRHRWA